MSYLLVIADDDLDWLRICVKLFEGRGFRILTACDPEELRRVVVETHPHLVLADRRLMGNDEGDISGERLARELAGPTPWLIMTKWPLDGWAVRDSMRSPSKTQMPVVVDYFNKLWPLSQMLDRVNEILSEYMPINFRLALSPRDKALIFSLAAPELLSSQQGHLIVDLEDLLRLLFRAYQRVTVRRVLYSGEGLCLLYVIADRDSGPADEILLLCGLMPQVTLVIHAHDRHSWRSGGITLLEHWERPHFAGAIFAFSGALSQVISLSEACRSQSPTQISMILNHFAIYTLAPWHRKGGVDEPGPRAIEQAKMWLGLTSMAHTAEDQDHTLRDICRAISGSLLLNYDSQHRCIEVHRPDDVSTTYPSPFEALQQTERLGAGWSANCGAVYGAAHPDQILIEKHSGHSWLWNYSHVSEVGLRIGEFAMLETAYKFETLDQSTLLERYDMELRLLDMGKSEQSEPNLSSTMQQAEEVISNIRRQALRVTGTSDWRPYSAALLLCAIRHLCSFNVEQGNGNYNIVGYAHCLLSAAMISQQLLGNSHILRGIVLDELTGDILLDGERVKLALKQRKLVRYLLKHPNRLCSYLDIICEGYEIITREKYEQMDKLERSRFFESERQTINTDAFRVRAAIEPNPSDPIYLITRPGEGLILYLNPNR